MPVFIVLPKKVLFAVFDKPILKHCLRSADPYDNLAHSPLRTLVIEEKWTKRWSCGRSAFGCFVYFFSVIFFLNLCIEGLVSYAHHFWLAGLLCGQEAIFYMHAYAKSDEVSGGAWLEKQMMELKMGYGLRKVGPSIIFILPSVASGNSFRLYAARAVVSWIRSEISSFFDGILLQLNCRRV